MRQLRDDLYAVRGLLGWVHLLVGPAEITLLDAGFIGDFQRIQRAVTALGRSPADLKTILITHGHLDHTLNAVRLRDWSGAKIYAPVGDELHIQGRYPYRGSARICGWLEATGRRLLGYQPPPVDAWLRGGDSLPFWGGLAVVALPGHTAGHVGFYSPAKRILFAGDLFAISWRVVRPPLFLNTDNARLTVSLRQAAGMEIDRIIPNHYFRLRPDDLLRFRELARSVQSSFL